MNTGGGGEERRSYPVPVFASEEANAAGVKEPGRSPIEQAERDLDAAAKETHALLGQLEARLTRVMEPEHVNPDGPSVEERDVHRLVGSAMPGSTLAPAAQFLLVQTETVQHANRRVRQLLERLAL